MRITVGAGTYVVAVSGGVDSMVLLDMLRQRPGMKLVVAHYDHGIRADSAEDRKLVQAFARKHGLPFVHLEGKLGAKTSEAAARTARYAFLDGIKQVSGARAVITAHHQDDVLETAIINLLRGTGRRGLTSLKSTDDIVRPLLGYDKEQIREYADKHAVPWREDSTNSDTTYLRNHVRHNVVTKLSDGQRAELEILIEQLRIVNNELDTQLESLLHVQPATDIIDRKWFINLPHDVSRELLVAWLRKHGVQNITKKFIEKLVVALKTGKPGTRANIDSRHSIVIKSQILALVVIGDGRLTKK
jgi:tRNA(Ile)-lysidine synthase